MLLPGLFLSRGLLNKPGMCEGLHGVIVTMALSADPRDRAPAQATSCFHHWCWLSQDRETPLPRDTTHLQLSQDYEATTVQLQVKGQLTSPPLQGINFPSTGYKKAPAEVGGAGSSQGQSPSPFPLINFLLFVGTPGFFAFSLHSPYSMKT